MSRRESVGRLTARTQSSSEAPTQDMVSVAVLPPRLAPGVAPPTGIAASGAISWDESLNWVHNEKIDKDSEPISKSKGLFRKVGLTRERQKANPDTPPFILRQVPYDVWRKHYAKDKDGNYKGTHAPAEDCLLKPHDVAKWNISEPVTKADKWTRGSEVLPVYAEVKDTHAVPEYEADYDGPPRAPHPESEAYLSPNDDSLTTDRDRKGSNLSDNSNLSVSSAASGKMPARQHSYALSRNDSIPEDDLPGPHAKTIADGKTAAQIIEEAKSKGKPKLSWKQNLHNGIKMASYGSSTGGF